MAHSPRSAPQVRTYLINASFAAAMQPEAQISEVIQSER